MPQLADILPGFVSRLSQALIADGREDLAGQFSEVTFVRYTYDSSCDAAYIYVQSPRAINVVEENIIGSKHGKTIGVEDPDDVFLDVDNFGRLTGIEVLQGGNVAALLSKNAS
jgi:uncharacterized protein YuzE